MISGCCRCLRPQVKTMYNSWTIPRLNVETWSRLLAGMIPMHSPRIQHRPVRMILHALHLDHNTSFKSRINKTHMDMLKHTHRSKWKTRFMHRGISRRMVSLRKGWSLNGVYSRLIQEVRKTRLYPWFQMYPTTCNPTLLFTPPYHGKHPRPYPRHEALYSVHQK